jgi:3-deoxy-manno-octulosonate cytidylyltransferase (CMP-KDO synthetase)
MYSNFCVLIPARYESQRLPGKPLLILNNKSILLRTFQKALKIFNKKDIYIFTDKRIVKDSFEKYTSNIFVIKEKCRNGTIRCSYGLSKIKKKYKGYLIISCDFPFISQNVIKKTLTSFSQIKNEKKYAGSTVHVELKDKYLISSKKVVKVVLNKKNDVMYFSRSLIPSNYKNKNNTYTHHGPVCLKYNILKKYKLLKDTPLQMSEENEWLKFLENGYLIRSIKVNKILREINDKKDLLYYKKKLSKNYHL